MGPQGHYHLEDGLYDKPRSRKKTYLYSAFVLLLLIAAGVGIGVVVSRLTNDDSSPTPSVTDTGTGASASSGDDATSGNSVGEAVATDDQSGSEAGIGSDSGTSDTGTSTTDGSSSGTTPPGTREFEEPPPAVPTAPLVTTPPATATAPVATATPPAPLTAVPVVTPAPTPTPIVAPAPAPGANATAPVVANTTAPVVPVVVAPAPVPVVAPAPAPVAPPTLAAGKAPNTWVELPPVPLPMGEVGAGVLTLDANPYLVIAGEHPREEVAKNGVTMILDLTGGEWYEATKRPSIGNHHAAEVIDNKLYLFGGLAGGEQDLQIGTLTPGVGGPDISWKEGATLPFASGSASTALIGGKVYYCGGIDKANTMTLDTCAIYSPTTNSWSTQMAPMPVGRNHAATCTDGKKMYVFGGRFGKNIVGEGFGETQIYDPATDTWAQGTPLTVARGGMGKAVYNAGKCYVFGGEVWENDAPSTATKITAERVSVATDIYTIGTDAWSNGADMPIGLHGSFPIKYDGVALLASGGTEAAYSQSTHALAYTL